MANWTITNNGSLIQIDHAGLSVFNNPKVDTEIKIVRAKTADNFTTVDKLYIGADTSWPCQILWNDVTVDSVEPTDVDNFSDLVEVILNDVSGGGTYSPEPIYITTDQASEMTIDTFNGIPRFIEGQGYMISGGTTIPLPNNADLILTKGVKVGVYVLLDTKVRMLLTDLQILMDGQYNIQTEVGSCISKTILSLSDDNNGVSVVVVADEILETGNQWTLSKSTSNPIEALYTLSSSNVNVFNYPYYFESNISDSPIGDPSFARGFAIIDSKNVAFFGYNLATLINYDDKAFSNNIVTLILKLV